LGVKGAILRVQKVHKGRALSLSKWAFRKGWALSLPKCPGSMPRVRLFKCSIVHLFNCSKLRVQKAQKSGHWACRNFKV